jgi:DNA-binding response OmpR family regulator
MPSSRLALVVSTDPLTAALLGLLLHLEQVPVVYETGGEALQALFDRVRPTLVLVDVDHPDGFSDAFTAHAQANTARVVAYSPGRPTEDVRMLATARGVGWFALPILRAAFAAVIEGRDG